MKENSMQKVGKKGYTPSAPPNYHPPAPVKVPPPSVSLPSLYARIRRAARVVRVTEKGGR